MSERGPDQLPGSPPDPLAGGWYGRLLAPPRPAGARPWWRVPGLVLAGLVWLVVVGGPSVLAVRQASFFALHPTTSVTARLSGCHAGACDGVYRYDGHPYTALGLSGRDGERRTLAVERTHPASWRVPGISAYVVAGIAWAVVGLPVILLVAASLRLRRARRRERPPPDGLWPQAA